jgi:deferrochelatase/peroxidase EfeB
MAVDLEHTLHWSSATGDSAAMLEQLQPNILKGHVRDHMSALFLRFDVPAEGRAFLRAVRGMMKSAKQHLEEVRQFKLDGTDGTPYVGAGLTAAATRPWASHPYPAIRSSRSRVA